MAEPTPRLEDAYRKAVESVVSGGLAALVVSAAASVLAHRYIPPYRQMTLQGKVLLGSMATFGYAAWCGEHRLYVEARQQQLVPASKHGGRRSVGDYVHQNRGAIVAGVAGASLMAALYHFRRNADRTMTQKLLSGRLFVQGAALVTALSIIGIGQLLSSSRSVHDQPDPDH
jgi:hypothetical protein